MLRSPKQSAQPGFRDLHGYFVTLVTAAIAISYFDRQTLLAAIQRTIPRSGVFVVAVRISDTLCTVVCSGGTDAGYSGYPPRVHSCHALVFGGFCALHGLATNFGFLLMARRLLGMGEGGAFPAAARVVAEWILPHQPGGIFAIQT